MGAKAEAPKAREGSCWTQRVSLGVSGLQDGVVWSSRLGVPGSCGSGFKVGVWSGFGGVHLWDCVLSPPFRLGASKTLPPPLLLQAKAKPAMAVPSTSKYAGGVASTQSAPNSVTGAAGQRSDEVPESSRPSNFLRTGDLQGL